MARIMGRLFRGMHLTDGGTGWQPQADILETENEILLLLDAAGMEPAELEVTAARFSVTVGGVRRLPERGVISCVHQLEMDHGSFRRTFCLSVAVDVERTTSRYHNGILEIVLPKERQTGRIAIVTE